MLIYLILLYNINIYYEFNFNLKFVANDWQKL